MDESDFSIFGKKKSSKHDKADATPSSNKPRPDFLDIPEIEKKVIVSRHTVQNTYNDYPNAGIAVVLNHKEVKSQKKRVGTEKDRDAIQKSLLNYGFDVRVYNDLTFAEISENLKSIAGEDHSQNDCFVLVVMSHGTEGKVYASDMSYPVERLWNPFLGENCKTLINKPKFFFVQACRGENLEKATTYSEYAPMSREINLMAIPEKPEVITYAIPTTADMLVMYSTFEKYFSFRNVENGSWFIQTLCQVLDETAKTDAISIEGAEIYRLLTTVNRTVAYGFQTNAANAALNNLKEMPNFQSTLTKMFYLKVKTKKIDNNLTTND